MAINKITIGKKPWKKLLRSRRTPFNVMISNEVNREIEKLFT